MTQTRFSRALSRMHEEGRTNRKDRSRLSVSGDAKRLRISDRSRAPPCHGGLPPTNEPTEIEISKKVVGKAAGRQTARRLTSMAFSWKGQPKLNLTNPLRSYTAMIRETRHSARIIHAMRNRGRKKPFQMLLCCVKRNKKT